MDVWAALIWCAVTVAAAWAARVVAGRMFPDDGAAQTTMHVVVLVWSWIVLVSLALGMLGLLNAVSLGLGVLLVAAASIRWARLGHAGTAIKDRGTEEIASPSARRMPAIFWRMAWCGVAGLGAAMVIVRGLLEFPSDWDTLMYHRPLMDHWLQAGSLYAPACWVWQVPGNNELLGLWWAAPFSGDFWVALMSVPAALLLGLGTSELGRLLGLTPLLRHAVALAALSSTVVFRQITDAKNDVAVGALFVVGVAYGLRYFQSQRRGDLLLSGASLGLLAGIKYYALGYAAVGWLGLVAVAWLHGGWRKAVPLAAMLAGVMFPLGGGWYARNVFVSGTPLYPVGYRGANTAAAEMPRSPWRSSIVGNGRPEVLPEYVRSIWEMAGPSQTLAVLALPSTAAWLLASGLFRQKQTPAALDGSARVGLAVMLLAAWLNFGITPFTIDRDDELRLTYPYTVARFSQPPLLLSLLALALPLSDLARWVYGAKRQRIARLTLRVLLTSFVAAAAVSFGLAAWEAVAVEAWLILLVAFDLAVVFLLVREVLTLGTLPRRCSLAAMLLGGCAAFALATIWLSGWWHGGFTAHYNRRHGTATLSSLEQVKGHRAAIASTYSRYYPFFGSRRQFQPFTPRRFAAQDELLAYLDSHGIDFLAIALEQFNQFTRHDEVDAWVEDQPEVFQRLEKGHGFSVYRINKNRLQASLAGRDGTQSAPGTGG